MQNCAVTSIKNSQTQRNYLFFVAHFLFYILGIILPFAIFWSTESPQWNIASFGSLLIVILSALRLSLIAYSGVVSPLLMTFWLFVCFWLGLAPFAQTLSNRFFLPGYYSPWIQVQGVFVVFLGILMYEIGRKCSSANAIKSLRFQLTITNGRVYALIMFALITPVYAIYKLGGISSVMVTRMEYATLVFKSDTFSTASALILQVALRVPPFIALLVVWYLWCNRDVILNHHKRFNSQYLLLISLIVLNLISNYPLSLPRYWLGTMVVTLTFITFKHTKKTMANWILGVVGILLMAFPLTSQLRLMKSGDFFNFDAIAEIVARFYHGDYDAYQQILNTIIVANRDGFSFGFNFIGALFFWIPRTIWTTKPLGSGHAIAEGVGYQFTNLSEPLWAESYYAFGLLGVIAVFYGYGYLSGLLDKRYQLSAHSDSFIALFVPFWMSFQLFFLRGDLMNGVAYSLPSIVVLILFFRLRIYRKYSN